VPPENTVPLNFVALPLFSRQRVVFSANAEPKNLVLKRSHRGELNETAHREKGKGRGAIPLCMSGPMKRNQQREKWKVERCGGTRMGACLEMPPIVGHLAVDGTSSATGRVCSEHIYRGVALKQGGRGKPIKRVPMVVVIWPRVSIETESKFYRGEKKKKKQRKGPGKQARTIAFNTKLKKSEDHNCGQSIHPVKVGTEGVCRGSRI